MTLCEFIENRLQSLGKTWSDLIDEGDISNIAAQQMQRGTWRRHSGTLQKLTRYLKCTANALKYIIRWKHKNGVEDLRKAKWYLERLIGECES